MLIVILGLATGCGSGGIGGRFEKIAADSEVALTHARVAEDGSYVFIDTNPLDREDEFSLEAYELIEAFSKDLGFPQSFMEKVGRTRAMDGIQKHDIDGVSASWSYHPDKGMEMLFESTEQ